MSVTVVVTDRRAAYAVGCSPSGGGNFFDGYYHNPVVFPQYKWEGASAYIVVRWPLATCTGSFMPWTNAWVMIASGDGGPGDGWGQSGYIRYDASDFSTQFQHVIQFADDGNHNGRIGDVGSEIYTVYVGSPGTGD